MGVMIVGIGFVALLTAALSQRFLARDAERIEEAGAQVEEELEETQADVLKELQAIGSRLRQLEVRVQRLGR